MSSRSGLDTYRVLLIGPPGQLRKTLTRTLEESPCVERCAVATARGAAEAWPSGGYDLAIFAALSGGIRPPEPEEARALVSACSRAPLRGFALVSSAAVHEPSHHHPGHVSEDQLAATRFANPIARRWRELEACVDEAFADLEIPRLVLRATALLVPGGNDPLSRLFAGRFAAVPAGFDPPLQLLAPEDLATALRQALETGAWGTYHLSSAGVVPLRSALRLAGTRRLPLPVTLQRWARKPFAAAGLAARGDALDHLCYPWTVDDQKLKREIDFEPRYVSAEVAQRQGHETERQSEAEKLEEHDPYGLDKAYADRLGGTLLRFMHDVYWRIEHRGLEHVPRQGRAVLTGVHRGHQPWDGVMAFHLLRRELGRCPRFLIHPTLAKFPHLAPYMTKLGGLHACRDNADWVLGQEQILGIFPEGIRGAFTYYRDAYRLGRFGRDEYVRIALRNQAPIVPFVTVGSAEIFPIFGKIHWAWWKRFSEWPCLPITPTMGLLPLPSKWHTRFLEPFPVDEYPPEAADDRKVVREISAQVKARMETALADLLARRKSIFFGSVFDREAGT